jgi:hypothetical protein
MLDDVQFLRCHDARGGVGAAWRAARGDARNNRPANGAGVGFPDLTLDATSTESFAGGVWPTRVHLVLTYWRWTVLPHPRIPKMPLVNGCTSEISAVVQLSGRSGDSRWVNAADSGEKLSGVVVTPEVGHPSNVGQERRIVPQAPDERSNRSTGSGRATARPERSQCNRSSHRFAVRSNQLPEQTDGRPPRPSCDVPAAIQSTSRLNRADRLGRKAATAFESVLEDRHSPSPLPLPLSSALAAAPQASFTVPVSAPICCSHLLLPSAAPTALPPPTSSHCSPKRTLT